MSSLKPHAEKTDQFPRSDSFSDPLKVEPQFTVRSLTLAIVAIGFLIGVVAASFSIHWPSSSWQNVLLLTLGSGFISTAIIGLMLDLVWSKARADEERGRLEAIFTRFEEFTHHLTQLDRRFTALHLLGLNYCHPSRGEALSTFLDYARDAENVNIVSSSARGLIGHIDGAVSKLQRQWRALISDRPEKFHIVLTHPAYAHLRQAAEERPSGEIELEILKTAAYLYFVAGMDSKQLRFYRGSPTVFAIQADKYILLNPYPYGKMAMDTLSLEFESADESSYVAQFVGKHFSQTWWFYDQEGKQVDGKPLVQGVEDFGSILSAFSECTFLNDAKRLRLTKAQIEELDHFVSSTLRRDHKNFKTEPPQDNPFMQFVVANKFKGSDMEATSDASVNRSSAAAT